MFFRIAIQARRCIVAAAATAVAVGATGSGMPARLAEPQPADSRSTARAAAQQHTRRPAAFPHTGTVVSSSPVSQREPSWELGYVTDVEGNLDYFKRWVAISRVVDFTDASQQKLELRPGKVFVYGGDVFDKGPGDLRIARMLIDLKQRHPDRVTLILGNRDVNKSRLVGELGAIEMAVPLKDHPGPYWVPEKHRTRPYDYIKQLVVSHWGKRRVAMWSEAELHAEMERFNTRANRLRYMLLHTMGSPQAFEFRRNELAELAGNLDRNKISDDDVVESFVGEAARPDGVVSQYLQLGQIGVCVGNTLIVHGAVNHMNAGFVPSPDLKDAMQGEVPGRVVDAPAQEWIGLLNKWAARSVGQWRRHPDWNADRTFRGGHALRGYCYKNVTHGRSAAVESMFGVGTSYTGLPGQTGDHPDVAAASVVRYLNRSGIQRVMVGHKPFGNSPTVMRSPVGSYEAVCADTSYSDNSTVNCRGVAVAEVCVQGTPTRNRLLIHGVYPDGSRYAFHLPERGPEDLAAARTGAETRAQAAPGYAPVAAMIASASAATTTGTPAPGVGTPVAGESSADAPAVATVETLAAKVGCTTPDGWLVAGFMDRPQPSGDCAKRVLLRKGLPHYTVAHEFVPMDDPRVAAAIPKASPYDGNTVRK